MPDQDSCPYTHMPSNIRVPPVPVTAVQDLPNVPRPSGDITRTAWDNRQTDPMGGTTPPDESSRNDESIYQVYQVRPPHIQNSLEPCTVTGKAPLMSDRSSGSFLSDPNSKRRECYNIKDTGQNMVGRVCTAVGTDGVLDSRERYDGDGVNGNADWVRGNRFGWRYGGRMINDLVKYEYKVPATLDTRKKYYVPDPFYPEPDRCVRDNCWYKTYPRKKLFTSGGYPTHRYPYKTTQPLSRSPVYKLSEIEGFENRLGLSGSYRVRGTCEAVYWVGIFVILTSLICCSKSS